MKTIDLLKTEIEGILPHIVRLRRAIHENPEIALQEHQTGALVREALGPLDLEVKPPFLETDVVALLKGPKEGKNVTLRADMDALPMQEQTGLEYASQRPGFMHACGHDGHTAMLTGAAMVLSRLRGRIKGSVRFVFQPGEEVVAAGKDLVKAGALLDPEPDAVLALHGLHDMPEGSFASRAGVIMGASGFFTIKVTGKGAHAARPEIAIDPILTVTRIVEALQAIASRRISPFESVVLSVCRITGGSNPNVIPQSAEIEGTTRYLNAATGDIIRSEMERIVKGVCGSMGASYEFSYHIPYIPTVNDAGVVDLGEKLVWEIWGPEHWDTMQNPSMGSEDFAYYLEDYPGALFRLGLGGKSAPLHSPFFDFNDQVLGQGILFLTASALAHLGDPSDELTALVK
jgi:hippurate hydrolase